MGEYRQVLSDSGLYNHLPLLNRYFPYRQMYSDSDRHHHILVLSKTVDGEYRPTYSDSGQHHALLSKYLDARLETNPLWQWPASLCTSVT